MKQRSKPNDRPVDRVTAVWLVLCVLGLSISTLAGCSGSDSSESVVVQPPGPEGVAADSSTASEPPGGILLPPGDIPPATADDPSGSGQGLELPENIELPTDSGASAQPGVEYGTWEEIQTVATSSGRITVVDLWSLSCEPCLKEFPGLVRLHQTLGSSVQCIAVDVDFDGRKTRPPEDYEDRVIAFLDRVGASGFPTYICRTPSDDVFAATDLVSIPAVLIYDAEGKIVKVFVDAGETLGFSYEEDVIPLVTKLAG
jgi:thiol-disulfide isomerase/thioredoxin